MPTQAVISIEEFCRHHDCETIIIEEFVEYGIFSPASSPQPNIPIHLLARVERALRLREDLGVNAAGIDIILNLLDRLEGSRDVEEL
jgi:chaperone modulatory protein CbpM